MGSFGSIASIIANDPVFSKCASQNLARFLPHVWERTLQQGESLQVKGEAADSAFYIASGAVEVQVEGGATRAIEHGFLGEEAAIGMKTYVATATATRETRVLVMPGHAIWHLATYRPLREALLASFSERFVDADKNADVKSVAVAQVAMSPHILIGWLLALIVPLLIVFGLKDTGEVPSDQALYMLAIIGATTVMWVFRLLPDFVPALFAVLSVAVLGLAPPEVSLSGFGSNTFFMALSIFGLSALLIVSGLSFRILLWLLRVGPQHKTWYFLSLFLSGVVLTPVVPTINGRVSIVAAFMNDLLDIFDADSAKLEAAKLSAGVIAGVSLFSAIFLSSKALNFLVFGLLPSQEQARFQWLDWFFAASVCGAVMLVLYFIATWALFRNDAKPSIPKSLVADQLTILGPMRMAEWAGVAGLVVLMTSFMTASSHHIDIPWIALAILFSLLMMGFLERGDFRNKIDWSFLMFLGGLIGMVASLKYVGLDVWVTGKLSWLSDFMEHDFTMFIAVLAATIFVVRLVMPIIATVVIFATLLIPTAVTLGVNPWLVGFIILLMAESFIWPYQASYYSQFCALVSHNAKADDKRILILNVLIYFIKLAAIYISLPYWKLLGLL